jgi:AbrB family looped-hinge helix DNA binding protein
MIATLDKFGRVLIPKKIREHLGISKNSSINITGEGNRIIIEPVIKNKPIIKKDGFMVFTGKIQTDMKDEISLSRSKRMSKVLGYGESD